MPDKLWFRLKELQSPSGKLQHQSDRWAGHLPQTDPTDFFSLLAQAEKALRLDGVGFLSLSKWLPQWEKSNEELSLWGQPCWGAPSGTSLIPSWDPLTGSSVQADMLLVSSSSENSAQRPEEILTGFVKSDAYKQIGAGSGGLPSQLHGWLKQKDAKFKSSLGYRVNVRSTCET